MTINSALHDVMTGEHVGGFTFDGYKEMITDSLNLLLGRVAKFPYISDDMKKDIDRITTFVDALMITHAVPLQYCKDIKTLLRISFINGGGMYPPVSVSYDDESYTRLMNERAELVRMCRGILEKINEYYSNEGNNDM